LNEKEGYHFSQVTVARPQWDRRRRGHDLPKNTLAQIFAGALYQFPTVGK